MKVSIKNNGDVWALTPEEGRFAGREVALVDGAQLTNVCREGDNLIGDLKACWGAVIVNDDIDSRTVKGLVGTRCFDTRGTKVSSMEDVKFCRTVVVMGRQVRV